MRAGGGCKPILARQWTVPAMGSSMNRLVFVAHGLCDNFDTLIYLYMSVPTTVG